MGIAEELNALRLSLEEYLDIREGLSLSLRFGPTLCANDGIHATYVGLIDRGWQRLAMRAALSYLILKRGPLCRAANGHDYNRHLAVLAAITNYNLDKNDFDLERLADATDAIGRPPSYTVDFTDFRPRLEELLGVRE